MNLIRYEPWGFFGRFHSDINRLFGDLALATDNEHDGSRDVASRWSPAVDITEEADRYVLTADVPGVDPKGIEVTMEDGVLTIKGERIREETHERDGFKRVERAHGSFYRRFSLPDSANAEAITANGSNGVLEISIPKHEKVQPRKISIQ